MGGNGTRGGGGALPRDQGASAYGQGSGDAVEIAAGDWVTFKRGFLGVWVVREPIAKRFAYFDADGGEILIAEHVKDRLIRGL